MENKEPFDSERFKNEAMVGLYQGKKMVGSVFAPMLKYFLESMLGGKLDNHLQESKAISDPNRRNGMRTRTICHNVKEMDGMYISATEIANTTDRIITAMNEWRNRPLEASNNYKRSHAIIPATTILMVYLKKVMLTACI